MEENANQFDDLIRRNFASAFISNEVAREPTLRQYMVPDENRHWAIHAKIEVYSNKEHYNRMAHRRSYCLLMEPIIDKYASN